MGDFENKIIKTTFKKNFYLGFDIQNKE